MNCILFGLGLHAKRIYLPFFEEYSELNKIIVVDFKTEKERLRNTLSSLGKSYELVLLNNTLRNLKKLPEREEHLLAKFIKKYNIKKAIISTEPRSHKMYSDFCLDYGVDILCDKPITTPLYTNTKIGYKNIQEEYDELLHKWRNSESKMFEIQTQRRAHKGYRYVWSLVNEIVEKYKVPINKISISHSDGNWNMPSETIFRENHPYKYGYGKLMHSGYHFIDLLTWFTDINKQNGFNETRKKYMVSDYRPSDFYSFFGEQFNESLGFIDKQEYYKNLNLTRNLGELDVSALIEYKDTNNNIICTASIDLSQSGISRRSWFDLPEDTYKSNGRIRHEMLNITVGPLLNIKVLSFQSTQISEGAINDTRIGGLDHFDILIFRNSDIIGGKPFEKIQLDELEDLNVNYIGQNEQARFKILNEFFKTGKSFASIETHKESIYVLSRIYQSMSERFNNYNFRFAVEAIIRCGDKFLICKRQEDIDVAPGIWNVPAGKVKHDEGIEEALKREVYEEVNLLINNVEYIDYHFINKAHQRIVFTYLASIDDISQFTLNETEFSEHKWVRADDIDDYETLNDHLKQHIKQIGGN